VGWAKSWNINLDALSGLGFGTDNAAKVKFRAGLNLSNLQAYLRVRFRTEPVNAFNIVEGVTLFGKVYCLYRYTFMNIDVNNASCLVTTPPAVTITSRIQKSNSNTTFKKCI
jgi:hypothetical protein